MKLEKYNKICIYMDLNIVSSVSTCPVYKNLNGNCDGLDEDCKYKFSFGDTTRDRDLKGCE